MWRILLRWKIICLNEVDKFSVGLKADKALSKLNFLFHLKSKINLVTLRICNSHLQFYKIDLSFIIRSPASIVARRVITLIMRLGT